MSRRKSAAAVIDDELDQAQQQADEDLASSRSDYAAGPHANGAASDIQDLSFFDTLVSLGAAEWEHNRVYLYRIFPKIDTGDRHYISRYQKAIDEESILADHGSGGYYAVLKDSKTRRATATHTFSLYRLDAPPKVDPNQVVRCAENEQYFNSVWAKTPTPVVANSTLMPATTPPPVPDATAINTLSDLARQQAQRPVVDQQLAELWQKTSAERDTLATKLAELSNRPTPAPAAVAPTPTPTPDPVEQMMKLLALLEKFKSHTAPAPAAQPRSAVESIKEVAEAIAAVRELQQPSMQQQPEPEAAPSAESISTFQRMMMGLLPAIAPSLGALLTALVAKLLNADKPNPAAQQQPNQQGSGPGSAGTGNAPGTLPATHPATQSGAQPETAQPATEEQQQISELAYLHQVLNRFGPQVGSAIANGADNPEVAGSDFALGVIALAGELEYRKLASHNPHLWIQALLTHPATATAATVIADRLPLFLKGFYSCAAPDLNNQIEEPPARRKQRAEAAIS